MVLETDGLGAPVPSFGNFDIEADVAADPFSRREVHLQAATALEWMALAKWAAQARGPPPSAPWGVTPGKGRSTAEQSDPD